MAEKSKSNEIRLIRVYDAPLKAVWDAWADPQQVGRWWGPRGFTITTRSKDLRTGGHWDYTMHGPDGKDYPNYATYLEVITYSKMVYDHGAAGPGKPPMFRVTVLFSEQDGKTTMDFTMALPTPEAAENTRKFIKQAGGDATWDRLAEHLGEAGKKNLFVINRSFDASIERMFELWTNPKHFAQWMGPAGSTMTFLRADIRPGGSTFYHMDAPNGMRLYGRASYLEIQPPHRLVYTQQFCDAQENLARHPMAPTWPATMLTEVQLTPEGPDRTRVTVTWQPHGPATPEEIATFLAARGGMTMGWTGSFDKLDAYLQEA